ncbi:hypothetical protein PanWU01x14_055550 [Parasponia andersonii]|uniref:Uncharacterized protein n=1 Tax=Parasponia andersonii TaxID=3476 RepID=A0A2P5DK39_PARAD|nr:hypothetical protein PanWU01x14_055550 [Parasponia andersonii]
MCKEKKTNLSIFKDENPPKNQIDSTIDDDEFDIDDSLSSFEALSTKHRHFLPKLRILRPFLSEALPVSSTFVQEAQFQEYQNQNSLNRFSDPRSLVLIINSQQS